MVSPDSIFTRERLCCHLDRGIRRERLCGPSDPGYWQESRKLGPVKMSTHGSQHQAGILFDTPKHEGQVTLRPFRVWALARSVHLETLLASQSQLILDRALLYICLCIVDEELYLATACS